VEPASVLARNPSTWAPFRLQFYCNGHSWLAGKLITNGIDYTMADNAFIRIDDWSRAQALFRRLYKLAESTNGLQWNDSCDEDFSSGWHVVSHVILRDDTGGNTAREHHCTKLVQDSGQPMKDPVVEKRPAIGLARR
jgi:hypothetical protein